MPKRGGGGSKRRTPAMRHKIEKKVREHRRDLRKAARTMRKSGLKVRSKKTREEAKLTLGISNAHPQKLEILKGLVATRASEKEAARLRREEAQQQRLDDNTKSLMVDDEVSDNHQPTASLNEIIATEMTKGKRRRGDDDDDDKVGNEDSKRVGRRGGLNPRATAKLRAELLKKDSSDRPKASMGMEVRGGKSSSQPTNSSEQERLAAEAIDINRERQRTLHRERLLIPSNKSMSLSDQALVLIEQLDWEVPIIVVVVDVRCVYQTVPWSFLDKVVEHAAASTNPGNIQRGVVILLDHADLIPSHTLTRMTGILGATLDKRYHEEALSSSSNKPSVVFSLAVFADGLTRAHKHLHKLLSQMFSTFFDNPDSTSPPPGHGVSRRHGIALVSIPGINHRRVSDALTKVTGGIALTSSIRLVRRFQPDEESEQCEPYPMLPGGDRVNKVFIHLEDRHGVRLIGVHGGDVLLQTTQQILRLKNPEVVAGVLASQFEVLPELFGAFSLTARSTISGFLVSLSRFIGQHGGYIPAAALNNFGGHLSASPLASCQLRLARRNRQRADGLQPVLGLTSKTQRSALLTLAARTFLLEFASSRHLCWAITQLPTAENISEANLSDNSSSPLDVFSFGVIPKRTQQKLSDFPLDSPPGTAGWGLILLLVAHDLLREREVFMPTRALSVLPDGIAIRDVFEGLIREDESLIA